MLSNPAAQTTSSNPQSVTVLGSTGSIGAQGLEVIRQHPERYRVAGLSGSGKNNALLARQAVEFGAQVVAVADGATAENLATELAKARADAARPTPEVEILSGPDASSDLAGAGSDIILNGITGSVGLGPTLSALRAGSQLALANKESLVAGADLVRAAQQRVGQIVPVDSEHSAIAQALLAGQHGEVSSIILSASGGPFRGWSRDQMANVTREQALNHPTWSMGPVITINSASMMNKGLELIEAHVLFDQPVENIQIVVHPQSVVHSMVEFVDGSTILQASPPDMRLAIAWGLSWPERLPGVVPACDWTSAASWTFEPLDEDVFTAVALCRAAVADGGLAPAVINAANEEAVAAFLSGSIGFLDIIDIVERTLADFLNAGLNDTPRDLEDVRHAEQWARTCAIGHNTAVAK